MMPLRKETDLYAPVKLFLEARGFAVKGEVNGCDLVAIAGDAVLVVELKAAFNLALVLQGIDRQRVTNLVYLAVEAPKKARGRWNELIRLCRLLGLGLLTVSFGRKPPGVEVVVEPEPYTPRRDLRKREGLLREFNRRSGDHNPGGSTRRRLVTAYREEALRAARYLQEHGASTTRAVRAATGNPRVTAILYGNVYGWFERVGKGVYALSSAGARALEEFAEIVAEL